MTSHGFPADSHVHTEWSWDARDGSMRATCARAVELGLPAIAFTEHVDHTVWRVDAATLDSGEHLSVVAGGGHIHPPAFDVEGYLAEIETCRERFPDLRILSGAELGEPHRHGEAVDRVIASGRLERLLGSVHVLPEPEGYAEPPGLWEHQAPTVVLRHYLAEVVEMVSSDAPFEILAHVDYAIRHWPEERFDVRELEEEFRHALTATAVSGRALEVNAALPMDPQILRWWHECGGDAISFGSDAHSPGELARHFSECVHLAEACGFRAGSSPYELWGRA